MTLRTAVIYGAWAVVALEALFVTFLFVQKNMGDDAAGRGMARGFAVVLGPIVLAAGSLLFFGQRNESTPMLIVAMLLIFSPILYVVANAGSKLGKSSLGAVLRFSQSGRFADPHLTAIAHAVRSGNSTKVESLANSGKPIDWSLRDRYDTTLLGYTVQLCLDDKYTGKRPPLEALSILLQHGAKPEANILGFNIDLMTDVISSESVGAPEVLRMLLKAGVDPNGTFAYLDMPYVHGARMPKLQILADAGAGLQTPDQQGMTPLMNDLYKQWWPEARFLVDRGVSVNHRSPEGATAESLLTLFLERAKGYNQPEDPALLRLLSDIHLRASGDVQSTRNAVE